MKKEQLLALSDEIAAKEMEIVRMTNGLLQSALRAYKEETGKNIVDFDWENDDAPACTYNGFEDLTDLYITCVKFDDNGNITKMFGYAYYMQQLVENIDLGSIEGDAWKRDLADAVIERLD